MRTRQLLSFRWRRKSEHPHCLLRFAARTKPYTLSARVLAPAAIRLRAIAAPRLPCDTPPLTRHLLPFVPEKRVLHSTITAVTDRPSLNVGPYVTCWRCRVVNYMLVIRI